MYNVYVREVLVYMCVTDSFSSKYSNISLLSHTFAHIQAGFVDVRLVEDSRITIQNGEVERLIGHIQFFSATYR